MASQQFLSQDDNYLLNINLTPIEASFNQMTSENTDSPSYSPCSSSPEKMESDEQPNLSANPPLQILEEIDGEEKRLSIWNIINDYQRDPLVKEYFNLLQQVKVKPCVPDPSILQNLPTPNFELPKETQIILLNNFTTYFQCRYSALNINGALQHDICLFSPYINFRVPQFEMLPLSYFNETKETKEIFTKAIQTSAVNGLAFTIELILLRTLAEIDKIVKSKSESAEECLQTTQFFYLTFYKAAKENFHQTFKVKQIDWSSKSSRVKEVLPKWRKESGEPPAVKTNRYASDLVRKLEKGKVKITSLGIIESDPPTQFQPSHNKNTNFTAGIPGSHPGISKNQTSQTGGKGENKPDNSDATSSNPPISSKNSAPPKKQKMNMDKPSNMKQDVKTITASKLSLKKSRSKNPNFNKNRNVDGADGDIIQEHSID